MSRIYTKGFTLIELSIVIVIIGLLVGGIVLGRHMMTVSQINAQISQIQKYEVAINTFKIKYKGLPADSTVMTYSYYGGGGLTTGSGNGNDIYDGHATLANFPGWEASMFFPALSASKLIVENHTNCSAFYTCPGGGSGNGLVGANRLYPEIKISSGNGMIMIGGKGGGLYYFLGVNVGSNTYYRNMSTAGVIHPSLAYVLDQKMDDGYPTTGKVYASTAYDTVNSTCCTSCTVGSCAAYTDPTVMELAPNDNTCLNTDDTYNADATDVAANRCRIVIQSSAVGSN